MKSEWEQVNQGWRPKKCCNWSSKDPFLGYRQFLVHNRMHFCNDTSSRNLLPGRWQRVGVPSFARIVFSPHPQLGPVVKGVRHTFWPTVWVFNMFLVTVQHVFKIHLSSDLSMFSNLSLYSNAVSRFSSPQKFGRHNGECLVSISLEQRWLRLLQLKRSMHGRWTAQTWSTNVSNICFSTKQLTISCRVARCSNQLGIRAKQH